MTATRVLRFLTLGTTVLLANVAFAIEISPKEVKRSAPPYEALSFVSEGPAYGHGDGSVRGRYHRVLILNLGLAYDRPTIRLETLTYGDEVCCRRVVAASELKLNELQEKGVPLPEAATTELRFVRWVNARTAELRYGKLTCRFAGIGNRKVSVMCK
jgi:hypothetical protein